MCVVFAMGFTSFNPWALHRAMMVFKTRYEYISLAGDLKAERQWLEAVRKKLIAKADDMSPIGKYRLTKYIERYMGAFAATLEKAKTTESQEGE